MSKESDWIEKVLGIDPGTGAAGAACVLDAAASYELISLRKLALLDDVRRELLKFKDEFQAVMSAEIKSGKLKGEALLKIKGTQEDELELNQVDFSQIELSSAAAATMARGGALVANLNERLRLSTIVIDGETRSLFSAPEIQEEFWTPLKRERILPETYIPAAYSETQQMIDQTNQLYLEAVEEKKAKGQLTPRGDRQRDILQSAGELVGMAGSLVGTFGPGTADFKLAQTVLGTAAQVIGQGVEVYDKVKDRKFADAASMALDIMGGITTTVLGQCGIDKSVTTVVGKSFAAGGKAILVGQAFARGVDGAEDGLSLLGELFKQGLDAAVAASADPKTKEALKIAAASAPAAFKQMAIAANLRQKILDEDYAGVVTCLGQSLQNALTAAQSLRSIKLTSGKSGEEAEKIQQGLDAQSKELSGYFDMGTTAAELTVKAAIAARKGDHLAALNGLIDAVGGTLSTVLEGAGVPAEQAKLVAELYGASASAPKALQCLLSDPPDVAGAVAGLGDGITTAMSKAAPGNQALQQASEGLALGFKGLAVGLGTQAHFKRGEYNEGISAFTDGLKAQVSGLASMIKGEELGEDDRTVAAVNDVIDIADEAAKTLTEAEQARRAEAREAMQEALRQAREASKAVNVDELKAHLAEAQQDLVAAQKQAEAEQMREEAEGVLAEARAEAQALSEAQQLGADASSIERLIAKLEQERMVLKLATQIAQGGTAFLAKFLPGLGVASAAIKLAAQMYAAGQRAQQLHRWILIQGDLQAAQSALSSSAGSFVKNQGEQMAHYAAQALFAAVSLAAEITKVTGQAAPAGLALDAIATTGAAIEEMVHKHYQREELERAWRVTEAALRNPSDRKLGLKARRLNGSLAKYSIAWGALVLKDPLARNAMTACNLSEANLNDKDADVGKVVAYLDSFYEDDQQLFRELDATPDWVPEDLSLSLRSWVRLKRQAQEKSRLALGASGEIDGLLAGYDALNQASKAPAQLLVQCRSALAGLDGKPTPDATAVRAARQSLADALASYRGTALDAAAQLAKLETTLAGFVPTAKPGQEKKAEADLKAMRRSLDGLAKQAELAKQAARHLADEMGKEESGLRQLSAPAVPVATV